MESYNPTGEYTPAYEAIKRRLQGDFARQRSQLAQSVATRGVRTSGVSFIPEETLGRGQAEAEAGVLGDFALRNVQDKVEDRRLAEDRAHELNMLERGSALQDAIQRRLNRNQLGAQLGAGALSGIGAYLLRPTSGTTVR